MTRFARPALGWLLAVSATVLLAALSRAPQRTGADDAGLLRLSWSGQPERLEVCRTVTDEELARLPQHMRQSVVCEGRSADYRLHVEVDGAPVTNDTVTGGGLRRDRPVYLYREFPLTPGARTLSVRFERSDTAGLGQTATNASRLDALPRSLVLDTAITLAPRAVILVTYDADRQTLILRSR